SLKIFSDWRPRTPGPSIRYLFVAPAHFSYDSREERDPSNVCWTSEIESVIRVGSGGPSAAIPVAVQGSGAGPSWPLVISHKKSALRSWETAYPYNRVVPEGIRPAMIGGPADSILGVKSSPGGPARGEAEEGQDDSKETRVGKENGFRREGRDG